MRLQVLEQAMDTEVYETGYQENETMLYQGFLQTLHNPQKGKSKPQRSPRNKTTPRNFNLAKGLALALTLLTARYAMQGMTPLPRGIEVWAPTIDTCPPIFGPPPVPPSSCLTRSTIPWELQRPPETSTWASQLVSWFRQTCVTWYNNILFPTPQTRDQTLTKEEQRNNTPFLY